MEALFDPAALPDLMTELTVSDEARKGSVTVHVMQRPGGGIVRGLALSAPEQLPRGATVLSSRRRTLEPVDQTPVRPSGAAAHGCDHRRQAIQ